MSDLYPAPSDARKKRRRAGDTGTAFYVTRGRPFVGMKEYRDRRREPDARVAVKLARELTKLAGEFPRFRLALNQLHHHVLIQVRSPSWKARTVLKCLDHRAPSSLREIIRSSGLDFVSASATLVQLAETDRVAPCNRRGQVLPPFTDLNKCYWLKK